MSARAPVIVRIKRGKAIMLGALMVPIALFGIAFFLLSFFAAEVLGWMMFFSLVIFIVFGGFAVFFFGIAHRQPVALRMDSLGISGYYATPATWDEITDIGTIKDQRHNKFLGFTLRDPIGFRDRQSAWGRLKSHSSGRNSGYHIIVPEIILQDTDVETLAAQARDFHTSA